MIWLVLAAVLFATAAQRISGLGFGLVASPFLILAYGPASGVVLISMIGAAAATMVMIQTWRDVEWRRLARLLPAAFVAIVVATVLLSRMDAGFAQVLAGLAVLLGLAGAGLAARVARVSVHPVAEVGFGAVSGAMGAIAGLSGPSLAALAVVSRWPQSRFLATAQPYFVVTSVVTVISRMFVTPGSWPKMSVVSRLAIVAAMLAGAGIGQVAARWLPERATRIAMIAISLAGATVAIVTGLRQH